MVKIEENIKGNVCQINCGKGEQQIQYLRYVIWRWVADCAVVWLETVQGVKYNETAVKVTRINGE